MKKYIFLLAGLVLAGFTASADTTTANQTNEASNINRGYGSSFIFVENCIEFSVFADGQFDFNSEYYNCSRSEIMWSSNLLLGFIELRDLFLSRQ